MKRFISLLLCVLLLGLGPAAYAAGDSALQILGYQQNDASLDILLYAKGSTILTPESFSVRLDDTKLPVNTISALSNTDYGTSWIVVLEPSPNSSITDTATSLVESLVNHLGPKDNLAVLDASTREMTSFVSDMPTIRAFVSAAAAQSFDGGYVRLYDAINTAFSAFKSNPSLNPRKCLLLVSGCVDTNSTCSFRELQRQAMDSSVTFYTVGITRGISNYISAFNEMRALSDAMPSGLAFALDSFPKSAGADAAVTILDNENRCAVLSVDLSELTAATTGTLHVSFNTLDASLAQVEVAVSEAAPPPEQHEHSWGDNATCQSAETCTICGEENPNGELAAHKDDGTGHCVWCGEPIAPQGGIKKVMDWVKQNMIAAALGGVLFILLIVLLIVLIKKKRSKADEIDDYRSSRTRPVVDEYEGGTMPVRSKVTIELTKKDTGERYTGEITDSTLRAGLESTLKLSGDPAISRRHMEFIWQNGILYVQDINSKNGTYVNGSKIDRAVALNQNDVIHAGESDFFVTWRSNS